MNHEEVDPCSLIEMAVLAYLRVHGRRILEIASTSRQEAVRIELRALFRYFTPSGRYRKLSDAVADCGEPPLELVEVDGSPALLVPLEYVRRAVGNEGAES